MRENEVRKGKGEHLYLDLYLRFLSIYQEWGLEAKLQPRLSITPAGLRMVENKEIMFKSRTY